MVSHKLLRRDIQGLRAIAVMAVLLCHFQPTWLPGGFVGVDIFFVISGFLMSAIILSGMGKGSFSLRHFYLARIRRIVPALMGVCVVLLALGWWWLPPTDYAELGRQVAAALGFVSNIHLKTSDGYFAALAQEQWLLHTWSLAVEWQFYLIFPLLLLPLQRFSGAQQQGIALMGLSICTVISLGLCIALTPVKSATAFYMLHTRFWELCAGGIVYLLSLKYSLKPAVARVVLMVGTVCLLISFFMFSPHTLWPGYAALLPVIGTCLLLSAPPNAYAFLSHPLLQWLGNRSYSLYLWHWPCAVALGFLELRGDLSASMLAVSLSVALAVLSYRYIETPMRRNAYNTPSAMRYWRAGFLYLSILTAGLGIAIADGFPKRTTLEVQRAEAGMHELSSLPRNCEVLPLKHAADIACAEHSPNLVLWGDSHAPLLIPAIQAATPDARLMLLSASCPPIRDAYVNFKNKGDHCSAYHEEIMALIHKLPTHIPVILAFRLSAYTEGYSENFLRPMDVRYLRLRADEHAMDGRTLFTSRLTSMLCQLRAKGRRVYVMEPIPEMGVHVPRTLARRMMRGDASSDVQLARADYQTRHRMIIAALENAKISCGIQRMSPVPYLCDHDHCSGSQNGLSWYSDDDHLNINGARKLIPMFASILSK